MSRLEDDLKQTLRRKEPPADFAARVMENIRHEPQPLATVHRLHTAPRAARTYLNPRLLAIAATVVLMILAGALWFVLRRAPSQPVLVDKERPAESKPQEKIGPDKAPPSPEKKNDEQHAHQAFKRQAIPQKHARRERQVVKAFQPELENLTAAELQLDSYPVLDEETARHLKKAQLLLRSFRNTELVQNGSTVDISFEKQLSRSLLADNRLYRREAETRRNLPVKGVLSSLEPFLLDIANLSDKPVAEEVRQIKERMRKREIVAELQVYAAEAATASF
jgi:hypothetical protein